jgi:predicted site-specific integrase-resolvase
LGVSTRTLANWVATGQIQRSACVVLPSGHRRYVAAKIDALALRRERA